MTSKDDLALLQQTMPTGVEGVKGLESFMRNGNAEVKKLMYGEFDLLYECRYCRNIFRSGINAISHKRAFCRVSHESVVNQDEGKTEYATKKRIGQMGALTRRIEQHLVPIGDTQEMIALYSLPRIMKEAPTTTFEDGMQKVIGSLPVNIAMKEALPADRVCLVMPQDNSSRYKEMSLRSRKAQNNDKQQNRDYTGAEIKIIENFEKHDVRCAEFVQLQCEHPSCAHVRPFHSLQALAYHCSLRHTKPFTNEVGDDRWPCLLCCRHMWSLEGVHTHLIRVHANVKENHLKKRNEDEKSGKGGKKSTYNGSRSRSLSLSSESKRAEKEEEDTEDDQEEMIIEEDDGKGNRRRSTRRGGMTAVPLLLQSEMSGRPKSRNSVNSDDYGDPPVLQPAEECGLEDEDDMPLRQKKQNKSSTPVDGGEKETKEKKQIKPKYVWDSVEGCVSDLVDIVCNRDMEDESIDTYVKPAFKKENTQESIRSTPTPPTAESYGKSTLSIIRKRGRPKKSELEERAKLKEKEKEMAEERKREKEKEKELAKEAKEREKEMAKEAKEREKEREKEMEIAEEKEEKKEVVKRTQSRVGRPKKNESAEPEQRVKRQYIKKKDRELMEAEQMERERAEKMERERASCERLESQQQQQSSGDVAAAAAAEMEAEAARPSRQRKRPRWMVNGGEEVYGEGARVNQNNDQSMGDDGGSGVEEMEEVKLPIKKKKTEKPQLVTPVKKKEGPPKQKDQSAIRSDAKLDHLFFTPKAGKHVIEKRRAIEANGTTSSSKRKQNLGKLADESEDIMIVQMDDVTIGPKRSDLTSVPVYLSEHQQQIFFSGLIHQKDSENEGNSFYECKYCHAKIPNIRDGRRHMVAHLRVMRLRCGLCGAGAFFCIDMRNHLQMRGCPDLHKAPKHMVKAGNPCMTKEHADELTFVAHSGSPGRALFTSGKIVSILSNSPYLPDPVIEEKILGPTRVPPRGLSSPRKPAHKYVMASVLKEAEKGTVSMASVLRTPAATAATAATASVPVSSSPDTMEPMLPIEDSAVHYYEDTQDSLVAAADAAETEQQPVAAPQLQQMQPVRRASMPPPDSKALRTIGEPKNAGAGETSQSQSARRVLYFTSAPEQGQRLMSPREMEEVDPSSDPELLDPIQSRHPSVYGIGNGQRMRSPDTTASSSQ